MASIFQSCHNLEINFWLQSQSDEDNITKKFRPKKTSQKNNMTSLKNEDKLTHKKKTT